MRLDLRKLWEPAWRLLLRARSCCGVNQNHGVSGVVSIFGQGQGVMNFDDGILGGHHSAIERDARECRTGRSRSANLTRREVGTLGGQAKSSYSGVFNIKMRVPGDSKPVGVDDRVADKNGCVVVQDKLIDLSVIERQIGVARRINVPGIDVHVVEGDMKRAVGFLFVGKDNRIGI